MLKKTNEGSTSFRNYQEMKEGDRNEMRISRYKRIDQNLGNQKLNHQKTIVDRINHRRDTKREVICQETLFKS